MLIYLVHLFIDHFQECTLGFHLRSTCFDSHTLFKYLFFQSLASGIRVDFLLILLNILNKLIFQLSNMKSTFIAATAFAALVSAAP